MHPRRLLPLLGGLGGLGLATPATAQEGFALDRFAPAERGSDWHANDSLDLRGAARTAAGLTFDYAHRPLVAYDRDGEVAATVVGTQFFAHLGGALVLAERLRLGLSWPLLLTGAGDPVVTPAGRFETAPGFALGDPRVTGDLRLLGLYGAPFTLAAGAELHLPFGKQDAYASDGAPRFHPRLLAAGDLGALAYAGRVGVQLRPHDAEFAGTELGHELTFGVAAGLRLFDRALLLGPELTGASLFGGGEGGTPIELLLGGKLRLARQFRLGAAAGPGLTQGFGSPALRVVTSLEWAPTLAVDRDLDGDGLRDLDDRCPSRPAGATPDPARPGCPARDRDLDGIPDHEDACPEVPGVSSPAPTEHGCPAPPAPPPPPPDRDRDGIPDGEDACPDEPGVRQASAETNGCPRARLETATQQIRILERIEFAYRKADLTPQSLPVLEAVREILVAHPELLRLEIQGHTDDIGPNDYNLELSRERAEAVRAWLVAQGIEAARLSALGYGESRPLADNDNDEGRQANRRVEFHIREIRTPDPAEPTSPQSTDSAPPAPTEASAPDAPPTAPPTQVDPAP